jgi:hypothetical protein
MRRFALYSRWTRAAVVLLLAAAPGQVLAATLAGVTMPDMITVQGRTLQLNGMGLRSFTFLGIHGYVAGLYLPVRSHDAQAILNDPGLKLLQIRYVHAAGLGRVQNEFRQGREANCAGGCPKDDDAAFAQLLATARPVKPGDTTTYLYGPTGLRILFNNTPMATIENADFARRMLASMIGAHPPSTALRDGLLGS